MLVEDMCLLVPAVSCPCEGSSRSAPSRVSRCLCVCVCVRELMSVCSHSFVDMFVRGHSCLFVVSRGCSQACLSAVILVVCHQVCAWLCILRVQACPEVGLEFLFRSSCLVLLVRISHFRCPEAGLELLLFSIRVVWFSS